MEQNPSSVFNRFQQTDSPPQPNSRPIEPEVVDGPPAEAYEYNTQHTKHETAEDTPHREGGRLKSVIKEIFGQFFTVEFWKEAARIVVQELFSTFLISFGNSVAYIGKQRRSDKLTNFATANATGGPSLSDKAFGNRSLTSVSSEPRTDVMTRFGFNH